MKLDLTIDHYQELIKKSYSLDALYLLNLISENYDVSPMTESSAKIKAIYISLLRKGIITDEEKITTLGLDLLEFVSKKGNKKFIKKKTERSDFDDWWEIFPSTDQFKMGNKLFKGTRGMRVNKEKCRLIFNKIINEGEFTKEDIIIGTTYEIKMRKSNSLKKNKNELSWMKSSEPYLNAKSFDPFIKLSKGTQDEFKSIVGSTDI
jgi:hypothetical protein